jgi:pyruvate formate lyase activating enzyme
LLPDGWVGEPDGLWSFIDIKEVIDMPEKIPMSTQLSRREFLKVGLVGICSLCLACNGGGALQRIPEKDPAQPFTQRGFVNPRSANWFSPLEQGRLRCELCPHLCELAEGARSLCKVRENRQGVGYTLAYGNPALVQEDPVERNPFFHVMPGSRALSVSTAGCNLSCDFCEVWDMALVNPEEVYAYDMSPDKIVEHALASGVRAISYAFGEPVVFYEYMLDIAKQAQEAGLMNLIQTAGYIQPEPLKELCKTLDAANVDLKSFDPAFYRDIVGGELHPVLTTLKFLREAGVHLEITNIIIPTLNDDVNLIKEMCTWIVQELGANIPLHFSRFYPLYRLSALPRTPVSTLDRARIVALEAGLEYVYIAKVTGHEGENTLCSACGRIIIKRVGFVIDEYHLENGHCEYCGNEIPGRWM